MSIAAMAWAKQVKTGSPTRKLVLLALADYADQWGYCWPTQKTLAKVCECTERTVRRAMEDLIAGQHVRLFEWRQDDSPRLLYQLPPIACERSLLSIGADADLPKGHPAHDATGQFVRVVTRTECQDHPDSEAETTRTQSPPNSKDSTVKNSKGTLINPDWEFGEKELETWNKHGVAMAHGLVVREFERFKAHHEAKGSRFKSWDAAWRTWCINARRFAECDRSNGNQRGRDRWAI